jgi:nitrate reductase gamma subunit
MNAAIFWDVAPWIPYMIRRFGGVYHLHLQSRKWAEQETSVQQVARQKVMKRLDEMVQQNNLSHESYKRMHQIK